MTFIKYCYDSVIFYELSNIDISMNERDLTIFPNDELGDKLWQLLLQGIDLNLPVEVEFSMLFPSKEKALAFGAVLLENNQKLSFSTFEQHETHTFEITAYPEMPLTYQNIEGYQSLLVGNAIEHNGIYDGWFSVYG